MDSTEYSNNIILATIGVILGIIIQSKLPIEVRSTIILILLFILFMVWLLANKIEMLTKSVDGNFNCEFIHSRKDIYKKGIELSKNSKHEILVTGGPKPWDSEYIKVYRKIIEKGNINFTRAMNCTINDEYFNWAKEELKLFGNFRNFTLIHNQDLGIRQIILMIFDGKKAIIAYPTRIKRSIDKGIYTKDDKTVDSLEDLYHNFYEDGIIISNLDMLNELKIKN